MSEIIHKTCDMTQKLMIGTAQFGLNYGIANLDGQISAYEITKIIDFLANKKNVSFDTASDYGESEAILGRHSVSISHAKIITKNSHKVENKDDLITNVNHSLQKLNRRNIDGILLHRFDQYKTDIWYGLKELKISGVTSKIGVSVYDPQEAETLLQDSDVDIIQFPFNILDWRWHNILSNKPSNKEFHTRSVYLQGALLNSDILSKKGFKEISDKLIFLSNKLHQTTVQSLILSYVASFDTIDRIIIGVDSFSQFFENYSILQSCNLINDDREYIASYFTTIPLELIDIRKW